MKARRKMPKALAERDERLYDEKVRLVRPGRLIAGLAMIGVAIIWLAVDNTVGPAARQTPVGAIAPIGPSISIPNIAVAQSFAGGLVDVVVQARPERLNGRSAPAGSSFLVLAVQVVNRSSVPLPVAVTDFTLRTGLGTITFGTAPAGHNSVFGRLGIPPKATAEGDLDFAAPNAAASPTIVYVPQVPGAKPLRWSVPIAGA